MVITAQDTIQKPGYKQTGVGEIPKDWEVCSLDDVVTKVGSGITPTGGEKVYKKEGRPFLRSQNVGWGHLLFDDIAFIDEETHRSFLATEIKLDDVLLNITGASIGRSAVADNRLLGGNVNQHVCIIRTDASKLNPYYLNFFLLSGSGQKQIESFQAGGNRQGLNFGQIRSFQIPLPPLSEQQVIATALSEVDALIASLDRLIAKKRDIKQATMQQLLTGRTRLPGFSGELMPGYKQTEVGMIPQDWKIEKLGDCLLGAPQYGVNAPAVQYTDSLPKYIRITDITEDGSFSTENIASVKYAGVDRYILKAGDLVFARTGASVGKTYLCKPEDGNLVFAGYLIRVKVNPSKLLPSYLAAYVKTEHYWNWVRIMSMRSGQPGINGNEYAQLLIPLPSLPEQQAITAVLSDIDTEIAALEQKRDKLRALKQGMMQELLTGKTRLL